MIGIYALISTVLAASALALGYATGQRWIEALLMLAWGTLWLLGQRRGWGGVASLVLFLFTGAAALGLLLGLGSGWMALGVAAALCAWDLDHFARRLRSAGRVERAHELERRHLLRLLVVSGLGFLLMSVALGLQLELGFGAAVFLGLLVVISLGQLVGLLRRESD